MRVIEARRLLRTYQFAEKLRRISSLNWFKHSKHTKYTHAHSEIYAVSAKQLKHDIKLMKKDKSDGRENAQETGSNTQTKSTKAQTAHEINTHTLLYYARIKYLQQVYKQQ